MTELQFGQYGLKALQNGQIHAKTIEAVRRVMTRHFKRTGQIWIRVFPDIIVTAKSAQVRMGKGKGSPSH
jgi:large subunit ribosomal protein L16